MKEKYNDIYIIINRIQKQKDNKAWSKYFQLLKDNKKNQNLLFDYICENDFVLAAKVLSEYNSDKIGFEKKIVNIILSKMVSLETVLALIYIEDEKCVNFYLQNSSAENKDEIFNFFDDAYNVLVEDSDYKLILFYIYIIYCHKNKLPDNIKKLKEAPIGDSNCQEYIKKIMQKIYQNETLEKVIEFAIETQSLNEIAIFLEKNKQELLEELPPSAIYFKRKLYLASAENQIKPLYSWLNFISDYKGKEYDLEKIYIILKIIKEQRSITSEIKNYIFVHKNSIPNRKKLSKTNYLLLRYFTDTVFSLLENPKELLNFLKITEYFNPVLLKYENMDNEHYTEFLKKEELILKEKARLFLNNKEMELKEKEFCYLNSPLKYVLSLKEFSRNFVNSNSKFTFPENIRLKGLLSYEEENNSFYLSFEQEKINISFSKQNDPSFAESQSVIPGMYIMISIASYNSIKDTFMVIDAKQWKRYTKKQLKKYQDILKRSYKKEICKSDYQFYNQHKFFEYMIRRHFFNYCYLYKSNELLFSSIRTDIKLQLEFRLHRKNEHPLKQILYYYLLDRSKSVIFNILDSYIEGILSRFNNYNGNLLENHDFHEFKQLWNLLMSFLKDIAPQFKKELYSHLIDRKLSSITYMMLPSPSSEYFEFIRNSDEIYQYYYICLRNPSTVLLHDYLVKNDDVQSPDLTFYITYFCLNINPSLIDDILKKNLLYFSDESKFIDWFFRSHKNYRLKESGDPMLHLLYEPTYENGNFTKEEEQFKDKLLSAYSKYYENISNGSIRQCIESIVAEDINILKILQDKVSATFSKKEKLQLIKPIDKLLNNQELPIHFVYKVLEILGENNPYYVNNHFIECLENSKHVEKESFSLKERLLESSLPPLLKLNFFFSSYLPSFVHFDRFLSKLQEQVEETREINHKLHQYFFYGYLKEVDYWNNWYVCLNDFTYLKKNVFVPSIYFSDIKFKIIPYIDQIKFRISHISKKEKIILIPEFDFIEEESLLEKDGMDEKKYYSLSRKQKEKVLQHMCRYNVLDAYNFDKEKVFTDEFYIQVAYRLSSYDDISHISLYLLLKLTAYDSFEKHLNDVSDYYIIQKELMELQRILTQKREFELYDNLLIILQKMHILHSIFLYDLAIPFLEQRKIYQQLINEGDLNNKIMALSNNKETFLLVKFLELNALKICYPDDYYYKFLDKYKTYVITDIEQEYFLLYVVYKIIFDENEISDNSYHWLKKLDINLNLNNSYLDARFDGLIENNKEVFVNIFESSYNDLNSKVQSGKNIEEGEIEKLLLFGMHLSFLSGRLDELLQNYQISQYKSIADIKDSKFVIKIPSIEKYLTNEIHKLRCYYEKDSMFTFFGKDAMNFILHLYYVERSLLFQNNSMINIVFKVLERENILIPQLIFFDEIINLASEKYKTKIKNFANIPLLTLSANTSALGRRIIEAANDEFEKLIFDNLELFDGNGNNFIDKLRDKYLNLKNIDFAYLLTLKIIAMDTKTNFTQKDKSILLSAQSKKGNYDKEIFYYLYFKVFDSLINHGSIDTLIKFLKITEKINPYNLSSSIFYVKDIADSCIRTLEIKNEKISTYDRIYLFLNTPMKWNFNFTEFLEHLYMNDKLPNTFPKELKPIILDKIMKNYKLPYKFHGIVNKKDGKIYIESLIKVNVEEFMLEDYLEKEISFKIGKLYHIGRIPYNEIQIFK